METFGSLLFQHTGEHDLWFNRCQSYTAACRERVSALECLREFIDLSSLHDQSPLPWRNTLALVPSMICVVVYAAIALRKREGRRLCFFTSAEWIYRHDEFACIVSLYESPYRQSAFGTDDQRIHWGVCPSN